MADELKADTSDSVVGRAVATRARLQRELREVEVFLSLYEKFTGEAVAAADDTIPLDHEKAAEAALPNEPGGQRGQPSGAASRQSGMRQVEFEQFAREIILQHGRPMQKGQLLQAIHAKGRRVGGHSETETLKSKLWRGKERIINISGAGYWPADVSCEAVSYVGRKTFNTDERADYVDQDSQ